MNDGLFKVDVTVIVSDVLRFVFLLSEVLLCAMEQKTNKVFEISMFYILM